MAPLVCRQPPPDLHRGGEVGRKRRRPEADVADEACGLFTFHGPETVSALGPTLADPRDESAGALLGVGLWEEMHDHRNGGYPHERRPVRGPPLPAGYPPRFGARAGGPE